MTKRVEHGFTSPARSAEHGFTSPVRSAEHGFTSPVRSAEHGFTLLEMLVALSILSLAALALVRLDGFALRSAASIENGALVRIVAANTAADVLSAPSAPSIGSATEQVTNGGLVWQVITRTRSTADPAIVRVDILATGTAARASLTLVRPAGGAS